MNGFVKNLVPLAFISLAIYYLAIANWIEGFLYLSVSIAFPLMWAIRDGKIKNNIKLLNISKIYTLASSRSNTRKSNRAAITSAQASVFHNFILFFILPSLIAHINGNAILNDRYRNPSIQLAIAR
jgi:hypothetical protein